MATKRSGHVLSFEELADSAEFARFFRMVWDLTGTVVGLADPTRRRGRAPFDEKMMCGVCQAVRSSSEGRAACMRDPAPHLEKAVARREPVIYECHAGLADFVAPVFVEGRHMATIEGGQMLLAPPSEPGFGRLLRRTSEYGLDRAKLRAAYFGSAHAAREKLAATVELVRLYVEHVSESAWRLRGAEAEGERPEVVRAREFIRQHHREHLTLARVAADAGLSPAYFSTLFSREAGMPFSTYLQRTRVESAKRLLGETDMRVTDVAFEVGFNSLPHFNYVFRRLEDQSPTEYRKAGRFTTEDTEDTE